MRKTAFWDCVVFAMRCDGEAAWRTLIFGESLIEKKLLVHISAIENHSVNLGQLSKAVHTPTTMGKIMF